MSRHELGGLGTTPKYDYRVEYLLPPTWVVQPPPGQHLARLEVSPVGEWCAEPNITSQWMFRQLTELAKGTSQASSYRRQESYFRHSQLFKETMHSYENEQGLQYREKPVHWDSEIAGSIIATVTQLQRELREAKDERQQAEDQAVDAKVHLRGAEDVDAQFRRDLFKSQDEMLEDQENARKYEKNCHEQAQVGNQSAPNWADQVRIQSLEEQLNDARQQQNQLHADHAPSAAEGQMAVQQSQTNEQLEALCAECDNLHAVIQKAVTYRDSARQANLKLQMQSLLDKASTATENSALREWCAKAEAEVDRLREENKILKQMSAEQESATATSAALRLLSFPTLSGMESGWVTQASPQLGGGMSGITMSERHPSLRWGKAPQRSLLGLSWDQLALPRFLPLGLDREGAMCFHQARIWGRPV